MKRFLHTLALLVIQIALAIWLVAGANCSWTKTSTPPKESVAAAITETPKKFSPGLDFLATAAAISLLLTSLSFCFKNNHEAK